MTVLILSNNDCGLWNFRRELIEELKKRHKVYFSVPNGNYVKKISALGAKYVPCDLLIRHGINPVNELKLINYYRNVLKKITPDIVFTYTIKPNAYGGIACAQLNIPYVANITGLGTAIENRGLIQKIGLMLYKRGLCKAQKVFFQNNENRDFMIEHGIVKGNYDILPGSGVNLEKYTVAPYPNHETVDFVFVARIMKEKGIEQYLDAAKVIRRKHPETRFHVCGFCEGNYKETLDRLNQDETIIYHGMVEDMTPVYKICSCVVHPTYYPEGLSNVLLEALASGRPVITTDRSGCREVVDDEINGFIVREKDSRDLTDKIEKFLRLSIEIREKMGLAGRKKVEREFDRDIVISKYIAEIDAVKIKRKNKKVIIN